MRGIALEPEGRHCFPRMTVRENLDLGAYRRRGPEIAKDLERIYELFPRLKERERQRPARCPAVSSRCSRSGVP